MRALPSSASSAVRDAREQIRELTPPADALDADARRPTRILAHLHLLQSDDRYRSTSRRLFQSVVQFFEQGGVFMIPLAICSVVSVAVIVLRGAGAAARSRRAARSSRRKSRPSSPGDEDAANRLARMVRERSSALARIIQVGLHHLNWPKSENMEAVQTRARHEIVRLESGLFVLEVIVGIAPLLGLLGAVSGLVTVFAAFGANAACAGSARHRQGHFRGAEHDDRRPGHRHPEPHRLQLFLARRSRPWPRRWSRSSPTCWRNATTSRLRQQRAGVPRRARGGSAFARGDAPRPTAEDGAVKFYTRPRRMPQVIIVSLIDIFAILLIFVIVTTTFKRDQPRGDDQAARVEERRRRGRKPTNRWCSRSRENEEHFSRRARK